jgi:hypothetical protein
MHVIEHTYVSLLDDIGSLCGLPEIRGSCYEGLDWATNVAPNLEKKLLQSLETGVTLDLDEWPIWLRRLVAAALYEPFALRCLRQLLLFVYKATVPYTDEKQTKAYDLFNRTNAEVRDWGHSYYKRSPVYLNKAIKHATSVLYGLRPETIVPGHGPGSIFPSGPKGQWSRHYEQIEYLYPYSDFMCLYFNRDHVAELDDLPYCSEISAKLVSVPKDARGPRLICVHPQESVWIQQGLRSNLERSIERPRTAQGPWPSGYVTFADQSTNGRLALSGSKHRHLATIDLKEASDRLSDLLVQELFGSYYKWFGCCRAQTVVIPYLDKRGVRYDNSIHSYAPMGNATTFPVQSLCFWAICTAALEALGLHQPGSCWVFGDDIIVPAMACERIIDVLEGYGLLVNRTKTFYRGGFRESCGVDAFNGVDVTPLRWRIGLDIESLEDLVSASNLAMRLRVAGFFSASSRLYEDIRSVCRLRSIPIGFTNDMNHGGIAEWTSITSLVFRDAYWQRDSQQFVSPISRLGSVEVRRSDDRRHLLASLCALSKGARQSVPLDTIPRRVSLHRGWSPIL